MNLTKFKKFLLFFLIFFLIDFSLTSLILKKTNFWHEINQPKEYWRIKSEIYDHDLKPNIGTKNNWQLYKYSFFTNSLGFRDSHVRTVEKENHLKKRILLIGDSFIEGMGFDYANTVAGLIENNFKNKFEVLNSGVVSYSSGVYYLKTKYLLDQGYKFDEAIIFLDVSDIYDELYYNYNKEKTKIINHEINVIKNYSFKNRIYKFFNMLADNTVVFQLLRQIRIRTEILKNYVKLRYRASREFNQSFFSITRQDSLFYRMLSIDRGNWTFNEKNFKKLEIVGVENTKYFLKKLFLLLKENEIKSHLVIYPWPSQIYYGDKYHQIIWRDFAIENNINFVNLYSLFEGNNKKQIILDNFILGDIHWNKEGTKKIFLGLRNNILNK